MGAGGQGLPGAVLGTALVLQGQCQAPPCATPSVWALRELRWLGSPRPAGAAVLRCFPRGPRGRPHGAMERGPHASGRVLSCDAPSHGVPQPVPKIPVQPLREQEPAAGSAPLPAAGQGHEWDFTSIGTASPGAASWGHPPPGPQHPPAPSPRSSGGSRMSLRATSSPQGCVCAGTYPQLPPTPFGGPGCPRRAAPPLCCAKELGGDPGSCFCARSLGRSRQSGAVGWLERHPHGVVVQLRPAHGPTEPSASQLPPCSPSSAPQLWKRGGSLASV